MKFFYGMALACLCLWLSGQPAEAAYVTGYDLLRECDSNKEKDLFSCMHYVAGVIDYQTMQQSMGTEPAVDFCLPEDLTIEEASVAVLLYLKRQRQLDTFIAAPSVAMALHSAYPCGAVHSTHKKKKKHG